MRSSAAQDLQAERRPLPFTNNARQTTESSADINTRVLESQADKNHPGFVPKLVVRDSTAAPSKKSARGAEGP
jgi:hypothetical protein